MASRKPLAVWLYGTKIATLSENSDSRDSPDGGIGLAWSEEGYDRWGSGSRVMSHLLPITAPPLTVPARVSTKLSSGPHPARVKVCLDGLLPEGNARTNYAIEAGLRPEDTYGLIARYGRDTAGALVFQPPHEPEPVRVGSYQPVTDAELGQRLRDAHKHAPGGANDRGRDSSTLAGLQPKITLHRSEDGLWQACLDGAPSSWIVKVGQPEGSPAADVIDTEVLSLDIARTAAMAAAHAEIHTFDGVRSIAVRRYDRRESPNGLDRIHQEDLAQALGLNTEDPLRKFQRGNRMPSLAHAANVLRSSGSEPDDLLRLTTLNYTLGNIDAHAKNISFLRNEDGTATLAPAYDIAMHMHHDEEQHRSALDINGRIYYTDITAEDLVAEGTHWGLPTKRAQRIVRDTLEAVRAAIDDLDPTAYPGVRDLAWRTVQRRIDAALPSIALARQVATPPGRPMPRTASPTDRQDRMARGISGSSRFSERQRHEPNIHFPGPGAATRRR
ncbi:MAG: HipA domain-containing protein [Actinomycetota bacterium]|nr:HipA domain-containing protein [Actinomycetota bacterium]